MGLVCLVVRSGVLHRVHSYCLKHWTRPIGVHSINAVHSLEPLGIALTLQEVLPGKVAIVDDCCPWNRGIPWISLI